MIFESQRDLDNNRAAVDDNYAHYKKTGAEKDQFTCDDYWWNVAMENLQRIRKEQIEYNKRRAADPDSYPKKGGTTF